MDAGNQEQVQVGPLQDDAALIGAWALIKMERAERAMEDLDEYLYEDGEEDGYDGLCLKCKQVSS
jgi:hypothetical protein